MKYNPEADRGKKYITREAWFALVPDQARKLFENLWDCFDFDKNNQLTVCYHQLIIGVELVFL